MKLFSNIGKLSLLRDALALMSGIALPFAFAPFNIWPLAILCLALLLVSWLQASAKRALVRGLLFGLFFFGTGISWVYVSMHVYGNASPFFAAFATALLVILFALYPAIQGYCLNRLLPKNTVAKFVLAFPASWVLLEWIRSWLFSGFPWLLLGYTHINSPLRGLAPVLGVFGLSLAIAVTAGILVSIFYFKKRSTRILLILFLVLLWLISFAFTKISWTKPIGQKVTVSLVQGNIPQNLKWQPNEIENILRTYVQLTAKNWSSDIIIWPECAIVLPNTDIKNFLTELDQEAKKHKAALITGIPIYQNFDYYNGVITLGNGSGMYLKHHLVPFGEYLPLRSIFQIFKNFVQIPMSDFGRGSAKQPNLIAHGISIAPFICYEIIFPAQVIKTAKDSQLLLLVTDDSWFGDSLAPAQHLEMGQMRALETGRYLLFDSNNGITAVINAQGKLQSTAPTFQPTVLNDSIQPMTGITPFILWGNYAALGMIIIFLMIAWLQNRK